MAHRHDNRDAADLGASLARLGVRELDERMELSSLLAAGDTQDTDFCHCECTCDDTPEDPTDPLVWDRLINTRIFNPMGPLV